MGECLSTTSSVEPTLYNNQTRVPQSVERSKCETINSDAHSLNVTPSIYRSDDDLFRKYSPILARGGCSSDRMKRPPSYCGCRTVRHTRCPCDNCDTLRNNGCLSDRSSIEPLTTCSHTNSHLHPEIDGMYVLCCYYAPILDRSGAGFWVNGTYVEGKQLGG